MTEHNQSTERRGTARKDVYLPLKLRSKAGGIIASGRALNVSCYGIKMGLKLEITFKTVEDKGQMDEVLSAKDLSLEIGDIGGELYMMTAVEVKWSSSSYGEGEKIYEAGLDLKLSEKQREEWTQFYERL